MNASARRTSSQFDQEQAPLTGAHIFTGALLDQGVTTLFGYPGASALPLFDALYDTPALDVVLPRHEQGAVHMADGYARATGKPGVALVTSGPGATNAVTGIANAYMDSIPLVVFTAQVSTELLGTDAFQEADITGITLPVSKHSYLVKRPEDIARIVAEAFVIATTGRPGPVVIDIPIDVARASCEAAAPAAVNLPGYKPTVKGNSKQIAQAARVLSKAARPLILAGGGVVAAEAAHPLKELAELLQIPVVTTLMGRGAFPEDHHLWLGMPGMHGAPVVTTALEQADVLLAVGVRFDNRVVRDIATFAPRAKLLHIDIDPAEIGKIEEASVPIVGDARQVLERLVAALEKADVAHDDGAWLELLDERRAQDELPQTAAGTIIEAVMSAAPRDAIIATEVGQNQMWTAQHAHPSGSRHWITSGGLGTMGFGLPAAAGAAIGCPDQTVVLFSGDGSFQMTEQELSVLAARNLDIKVFILNNATLGMVRQWQDRHYSARHSSVSLEVGNPDFLALAAAYGIDAARIDDPSQACAVADAVFAKRGPAVIDCVIPPQDNVEPVWGGRA